ncbi:MAG: ATP-binding protein [Promethearchaeota archaeon]
MSEVKIFDPLELTFRGLAIASLLVAGLFFFYKGQKKNNFDEKILSFGFGSYFIGLAISQFLYPLSLYFLPGTYEDNAFFGNYDKAPSIYFNLVIAIRIAYAVGALLFIFSFEIITKKTKYTISIIQVILIIIITFLPFVLAYFFIIYILGVFSTICITIILYFLGKWSKFEFKGILFPLLFGFLLIVCGLIIGNPDAKELKVMPLFLAPLLIIIGTFVFLSPSIINLKIYTSARNFWILIGFIIGSFIVFLEFIFIFFRFPIMIGIISPIIFITDLFILIKLYKLIGSHKKEEIEKEYANILGIFAKSQKLIEELITENAEDLITIYGVNFDMEFINEKAHFKLLGYLKEDLIGKKRKEFIHPNDFEKSMEMRENLIQNGEEVGELRFKKKNGQYIWFETRSVNFIDNENEKKYLSISRDITEKIEAEKILEKENKMLKELDELKDDFIIRATHDLKTPLTYMLGNSNIIYDIIKEFNENISHLSEKEKRCLHFDIKTLEEIEILAKDMCDGTLKMNKMALDLLNLSLLESHRFNLKKENFDVSDIIQKCAKELDFEVKRRKIDLSCKLPEKLFLNVDKQRLSEIFQNLLSNALKYTPIGGKISIFSEQNNDYINFYVKDNGIGLTNEDKEKIFTKYSKIERNEKNLITDGFGPSYGLGLYITKELVLSHDGEINVFSEGKNKGTLFKIKLPIN